MSYTVTNTFWIYIWCFVGIRLSKIFSKYKNELKRNKKKLNKMFSLIVTLDEFGGIATEDGSLPWKNKYDMVNFKNKTTNNVVIMGRKTWDSLPSKFKPLPNRINIVISSNGYNILDNYQFIDRPDFIESLSLDEKLKLFEKNNNPVKIFTNIRETIIHLTLTEKKLYKNKELFVIGGATIYNYFLQNNMISKVYLTQIFDNGNCTVKIKHDFYNRNLQKWKILEITDEKTIELTRHMITLFKGKCHYQELEYVNNEENQFLQTLRTILTNGYKKSNRTLTKTLSIFGNELRFDLSNNKFPLLTTRNMTFRLIFEELIWFLRGQTDSKILESKNVNIWKANSSREFLDGVGLHEFEVGDIGNTYGFLYRHLGATYIDCKTDYSNQGFDQVQNVINLLKNDPDNRRIIINLWDPNNFDKATLPPCCFNYQFYVTPNKGLITKATQRSSDISLAGGFNIASASLLTIMLARICGLQPYLLIWSTGDTHIYENQLDSVREQLKRNPRPFPQLWVRDSAPSFVNGKEIVDFECSDFMLVNYNPYDKIKIEMNA